MPGLGDLGAVGVSWSRFQSAISASWWDCSAASNVAAAGPASLIRQQVNGPSVVLVIEGCGAGRSGSGRGSSLTAVRSWLTEALRANSRVMGIGALPGAGGDDADLIE